MYFDYFGLTENPFPNAPNPRYLYMSHRHQEALAHLLFGVQEGGGFVQLTGEVGTGKTTLTRALLEQLPANVDVALILNPKLSAQEFLASICDELKIAYKRDTQSIKDLVDALNTYLLSAHASGRRVVLIVDEAQNFQPDVLEQIRLLTNLETTQQKLLQIILVGQPELRDLLARKELRQLAQRVTARYHLAPMTYDETAGYIKHRLKVAGANQSVFTTGAIRQLWRCSAGIPRVINILADRCLLAAYTTENNRVSKAMVKQANKELHAQETQQRRSLTPVWLAFGIFLIAGAGGYVGYELSRQSAQPAVAASEGSETVKRGESLRQESASETAGGIAVIDEGTAQSDVLTAPLFTQRLATDVHSLDLTLAFRNYFTLWNMDFNALTGATGCEKALSAGKRCYWGHGNWQEIVRLNYPVLVSLDNPENAEMMHYFVVSAVDGRRVTVEVGRQRDVIDTREIEKIWPGKFLLIWQPPNPNFDIIRPGTSGPMVLELRKLLQRALPNTLVSLTSNLFDEVLQEQVRQFQRMRGLSADGVVGDLTMLHLASLGSEGGIPLLQQTK